MAVFHTISTRNGNIHKARAALPLRNEAAPEEPVVWVGCAAPEVSWPSRPMVGFADDGAPRVAVPVLAGVAEAAVVPVFVAVTKLWLPTSEEERLANPGSS